MWLTNLPSMEPPIPVSLSLMLRSFIYTLNSRGDKMNELIYSMQTGIFINNI